MSNTVTTINFDDENLEWIDSHYDNRSQFINDMVTQIRKGESVMGDATLSPEIRKLRAEIEGKRGELEAKQEQLEELIEAREDTQNSDDYEDDVAQIASGFVNNQPVFPSYRTDVQELSEKHGKAFATVAEDIKTHAIEHFDISEDSSRWTDNFGDTIHE